MIRTHWLPLLAGIFFLAFSPCGSAGDAWRPITDRDLTIRSGNILDFSALVATREEKQARLFCASQPYGVEEDGFPDHATADAYARQLRLHGYNLARFHFVENVLMAGRTRDFDFDPVQVDRFHYFLSALKREGISWMMDGLTSPNGAYGDVGGYRWAKKHNVKAGVYYDPKQQAHWKELVGRILGARNPYTGMRILDDSALYGVILVNEGGLNHLVTLDPDPELDRLFEQWLLKRYGSVDAARQAWGTRGPDGDRITLPRIVWTASPWVVDAQRFFYDAQREVFRWMSEYIRDLGFRGHVTAFDNWPNLQDQATRAHMPLVDMHAYHEDPSKFVHRGSRVGQTSSLDGGLEYVRRLATARYWGKPFTVSEYDHPFWGRWRYESGLAVGAYAAFQGWDLICRHASGPIELAYGAGKSNRRKVIYPYGVGTDPVGRANETLAALLYLRGDVAPARHRIGIRLTEVYVFEKRGGIGRLPDDMTRLGQVTGIGLVWDDQTPDVPLNAVIEPGGKPPTLTNKLAAKVGLSGEQSFAGLLSGLQARGLLAGNKSDGKNRLVSDTGEIILEPTAKLLKVITPRTEAAAFEKAPGRLGALTISQSSGPAMFSASSMDGRSLDKSGRILLILATDARNSGMRFADAEERELVALGTPPLLMRSVHVEVVLRHAEPTKLSLYALRLNGERAENLPLVVNNDTVSIKLDTATLKYGPTTFFELTTD